MHIEYIELLCLLHHFSVYTLYKLLFMLGMLRYTYGVFYKYMQWRLPKRKFQIGFTRFYIRIELQARACSAICLLNRGIQLKAKLNKKLCKI